MSLIDTWVPSQVKKEKSIFDIIPVDVRSYIRQLIPSLGSAIFLAGGSIADCYRGVVPKDIDLWCIVSSMHGMPDEATLAGKTFIHHTSGLYSKDTAEVYTCNELALPIDLIYIKTKLTAIEVINMFDMDIARAGVFNLITQEWKIQFGEAAIKRALDTKTIHYSLQTPLTASSVKSAKHLARYKLKYPDFKFIEVP